MPRYEFSNDNEFLNWATGSLNSKKYELVCTSFGEVIAVPVKSTRPLIYGYVSFCTVEQAKKLTGELNKQFGVKVLAMKKFVWSTEREPQTE